MAIPTVNDSTDKLRQAGGTLEDQQARAQAVIRALREWMADESGYDEENWPKLKKVLEESHDSDRKLFSE